MTTLPQNNFEIAVVVTVFFFNRLLSFTNKSIEIYWVFRYICLCLKSLIWHQLQCFAEDSFMTTEIKVKIALNMPHISFSKTCSYLSKCKLVFNNDIHIMTEWSSCYMTLPVIESCTNVKYKSGLKLYVFWVCANTGYKDVILWALKHFFNWCVFPILFQCNSSPYVHATEVKGSIQAWTRTMAFLSFDSLLKAEVIYAMVMACVCDTCM